MFATLYVSFIYALLVVQDPQCRQRIGKSGCSQCGLRRPSWVLGLCVPEQQKKHQYKHVRTTEYAEITSMSYLGILITAAGLVICDFQMVYFFFFFSL